MKTWQVFYLGSLIIGVQYQISGELRHVVLSLIVGFLGLVSLLLEVFKEQNQ